jgi:hypothetical protein
VFVGIRGVVLMYKRLDELLLMICLVFWYMVFTAKVIGIMEGGVGAAATCIAYLTVFY